MRCHDEIPSLFIFGIIFRIIFNVFTGRFLMTKDEFLLIVIVGIVISLYFIALPDSKIDWVTRHPKVKQTK